MLTEQSGLGSRPSWLVIQNPGLKDFGVLTAANSIQSTAFHALKPVQGTPQFRGWDNEAYHAQHTYFWQQSGGIILEMGALDGHQFSISSDFLDVGWYRILVEASPSHIENAKIYAADSTYVNAAICESDATLHYSGGGRGIEGILEWQTNRFIKQFHPKVWEAGQTAAGFNLSAVDWTTVPGKAVTCLPLQTMLSYLQVSHINYFSLDVEGAELNVLQSIDWSITMFDVLGVEVDPMNRPPGYASLVKEYVEARGYVQTALIGRNAWFLRDGFTPSTSP
jgi:hypothetical protein